MSVFKKNYSCLPPEYIQGYFYFSEYIRTSMGRIDTLKQTFGTKYQELGQGLYTTRSFSL